MKPSLLGKVRSLSFICSCANEVKLISKGMSCISSAVRLVLWFSKVQFLKRLADRVDYYERSEVCMFSFAKQGNGFRARPVGGAGNGVD